MSENNKESSLTTPEDRDSVNKWKPNQFQQPLSTDESNIAIQTLNNTAFTDKFPKVDRTYADQAIALQNIGLISFVPAQGATPNSNGVFGFAKLRGNFSSEMEANQRAEYLIKNVDSYHQIYHTYVGRPFPITVSSDYSAETAEIDIRKETTRTISNSIKEKKEKEQQQVKDIKEREELLLAESKRDSPDDYENYITLRVKKAQLSFTYLEHLKKLDEIKNIILKTREEVIEMDRDNPSFKDSYYEKYMKAREDAGIKETKEESQGNFIKFLVEEAVLPGIDDV